MTSTGNYIAAIDQGTTSSRCIIFGADGRIVSVDQQEHRQIFPSPATSSTTPPRSGPGCSRSSAARWRRPA